MDFRGQTLSFSKEGVSVEKIGPKKLELLGYLDKISIGQIEGVDAKMASTVERVFRTPHGLLLACNRFERGRSKLVYQAYELREKTGTVEKLVFHWALEKEAVRHECKLLSSLEKKGQFVDPPRIVFDIPKGLGATQTFYPYDGFSFVEGDFSKKARKSVCDNILLGVTQLHQLGIVHCDLKLDNIIIRLEKGWPVAYLADFGDARRGKEIKGDGFSRIYLAPEVAKTRIMTPATDTWAAGITTFSILAERFPFDTDPVEEGDLKTGLGSIEQEEIVFNLKRYGHLIGKRWSGYLRDMLNISLNERKLPKPQISKQLLSNQSD